MIKKAMAFPIIQNTAKVFSYFIKPSPSNRPVILQRALEHGWTVQYADINLWRIIIWLI
jgi:hypothetical protein